MKKILAILLTLALCLSMLAACGSKQAAGEAPAEEAPAEAPTESAPAETPAEAPAEVAPEAPRARFCPTCGHEFAPADRFCQSCGTPVPNLP